MLQSIFAAMEDWEISQIITDEPFWFPALETLHVGALTFVVGTILFVDLRLMGLAGRYEPARTSLRILSLTWAAFAIAAASGTLMFAPAAARYAANSAFQLKMLAMALAGLNMLAFHFGPWRRIASWNEGRPPASARACGLVSMALWIAAVILGRYVPFTQ